MRLPRQQLVSDLLHNIAGLVQEADLYLRESDLFKSIVKPLPKVKVKSSSGGALEPFAVDRITNNLRRTMEKLNKPSRDLFTDERERRQRSRYQKRKLVKGAPRKSFGSRLRDR